MEPAIQYARFGRRLRALCLDAIVFALLFALGAVFIHSLSSSESITRGLWLAIVLAILFYEPLLVAAIGGTIGHRLTNLRVVDDRSKGNLSFVNACVRAAVKTLLGWYSFLTMSLTRRNQAVHDVVTHSTVQIRDISKAPRSHYVMERQMESDTAARPSRSRRVAVILIYIIFGYLGTSLVSLSFLSDSCVFEGRCSEFDRTMTLVFTFFWLALVAFAVVFGWKGRLWGCRIRPSG